MTSLRRTKRSVDEVIQSKLELVTCKRCVRTRTAERKGRGERLTLSESTTVEASSHLWRYRVVQSHFVLLVRVSPYCAPGDYYLNLAYPTRMRILRQPDERTAA